MSPGLPGGTGHGKVRGVTVSDVSRNTQEVTVTGGMGRGRDCDRRHSQRGAGTAAGLYQTWLSLCVGRGAYLEGSELMCDMI